VIDIPSHKIEALNLALDLDATITTSSSPIYKAEDYALMHASNKTLSLSPQNDPPLLRLPVELHLIIASYLRSYSNPEHVQYPRSTSRYFHHIIPPPFRTTLRRLQEFPYIQESHCGIGSCKMCRNLQLRPQELCADCWGKVPQVWNQEEDGRLKRVEEERQERLREGGGEVGC
jgi:hypothetical protein